ncbi:SDR family NAD(P)-dependent oxidoreductase [Methylobrevis pamukkalensis]|uniref:SDR family NAD(P)-dependent oxidoreductase n=1 Tax=Methylobrevis pamukkalensis TaxID=1439726 RepID=UPI001FD92A8F|nr:SDR family NAD(P)-dependent oxidoreductase [Methylobrevis pamukkalensis]
MLLFSGQGSQYSAMGARLHPEIPAFRAAFDACADRFSDRLGTDLRRLILDGGDIDDTARAQPALFTLDYALGRLWLDAGLVPRALHGHSIGEYVAACLAGVFDLDTAVALVAERARLMQTAPPGAMLAVMHAGEDIGRWLDGDIVHAAANAPGLDVLAGPGPAIDALQGRLKAAGIASRRLKVSHAFHSPMMAEAAAAFRPMVAKADLRAPALPVISNVTGSWLSAGEATDPEYWIRHLLGTVRFGDGTATLDRLARPVFLEAGPGEALATLVRHQIGGEATVLPGLAETARDTETTRLLAAAGHLWQAGAALDLSVLAPSGGHRVPLPTYPFQRRRHWITAPAPDRAAPPVADDSAVLRRTDWRRAPQPGHPAQTMRSRWLVFDDGKLGTPLSHAIERAGEDAYRVVPGAAFAEPDYRGFTVRPGVVADHGALLDALGERGANPDHIVFLWSGALAATSNDFAAARALRALVEALAADPHPVRLTVVTRGARDVTGTETLDPASSALAGLLQVAGQEHPFLGCRHIDLDPDASESPAALSDRLRQELAAGDAVVAIRGRHRWLPALVSIAPAVPSKDRRLKPGGVHVLVGDLAAGLGRIWVDGLARLPGVRLVLLRQEGTASLQVPAGIEALDLRIDCTDAEAVGRALDEVVGRFGRIDGLFLSLPLIIEASVAPVSLIGDDHWAHVHRTKIAPLHALARAASGRRIGFACVQSSLSTEVGGLGLGAYAAAYHAVDTLTTALDRSGDTRWFAICYAVADETTAAGGRRAAANPYALPTAETFEATRRILEAGLSGRTVLARGDLAAAALRAEPVRTETTAAAGGHRRPDLAAPFLAPRGEVEETVAAIFRRLLGLDAVGANDGFFELGGHSLMAVRAVAELRKAFPVEIEMRDLLFDNPTVAGIAAAIAARLPQDDDLAAMAALLDEVEGLSDDELNDLMPGATAP